MLSKSTVMKLADLYREVETLGGFIAFHKSNMLAEEAKMQAKKNEQTAVLAKIAALGGEITSD